MIYILSVIFGLIQFAIIGYILLLEVKRKSPAVFLWATLFIMFAFPHLITVFIEDMAFSSSVFFQASLFVCAFCLIYLLFRTKKEFLYIILPDKKKFAIDLSGIEGTLFEHICLCIFLISIVGYVFFFVRAQGGLFNTSWASAREVRTSYVSFQGLAIRLIFSFSGLSLFYFLTSRKVKSIIILILFICLVTITRNRVQIIPVLAFIISLYLIKIERIRIKHIIIGVTFALAVIYILYSLRAFRYLGTLENALSKFSWNYINSTVYRFINNRDGELGLRQHFYFFIQNNNNFEGFNRGYTYIRMLLVYLPSQWSLGLKPQSFDLFMGKAIGMATGGSTHPTLFGDCFGNLWWFGILLGGFWACVANVIDKIISKQNESFFKIMLYFLAAYSYVVIGRGSVYNGFEVLAWGALILIILKSLSPRLVSTRIVFVIRNRNSYK